MKYVFKYGICLMAIVILCGVSCKKTNQENSEEFAKDPNFSPTTEEFKVSIIEFNNLPCLYENNFLKVSVDSLPFSSIHWYIYRDGTRLLMSNEADQVIVTEGDYELDYKYNKEDQIKNEIIKFTVNFCEVEVILSDAFSPDGDGQYDEWRVITKGVSRFSCVIKNDKDLTLHVTDNPDEGWDGTFEGRKMPSGTYGYAVEGAFKNGDLFEYIGTLELIR